MMISKCNGDAACLLSEYKERHYQEYLKEQQQTTAIKSCDTCVFVHRFTPRPDELAAGHVLGCKKPGWEGYTSLAQMACGGVFYVQDTTKPPARGGEE